VRRTSSGVEADYTSGPTSSYDWGLMSVQGAAHASRAAAALIVVLLLSVSCASPASEEPSLARAAPTATPVAIAGSASSILVERFTEDVFGNPAPGPWSVARGSWAVTEGTAGTADTADVSEDSAEYPWIALVELGTPDAAIQMKLTTSADGAGMAFRYLGPSNHWAIVAAPTFGTWNLIRVRDGVEELVDNVGSVNAGDGATIGVLLDGDRIFVTVDGAITHVEVDATHATGTQAGLWAGTSTARNARWDDFVAVAAASTPVDAEQTE
jgi:hypothetical protein